MTMMNKKTTRNRQRGAVLLTSMLLLVVVVLLSLSATQSTILQERMTGNVRESNQAFQTAEDIIRQVEIKVREAAVFGTTGEIGIADWKDVGLSISDCSGRGILNDPSLTAAWPDAPEPIAGRATRYIAIAMNNVSTRSVACRPVEEENPDEAGLQSSYYMVLGYAESPALRADSLVVTLFYYQND